MLQTSRKTYKNSVDSVIPLITDYRLLIFLPLILSGCMGVYEGGFECPPGKGVGCKSISEVNDMINHGDLPKSDSSSSQINEPENSCKTCGSSSEISSEKSEIWINPLYLIQQKENHGRIAV